MTGAAGDGGFVFGPAEVALPTGAFAGGSRHVLAFRGRPVVAFTYGAFRPYLHPVWTPAGAVATAERAADHPHHCGIWCAADHVGLMMQGPDAVERYDYNFYVDDVFQGRAPGRLVTTGISFSAEGTNRGRCTQRIEWRGPREWAAPEGRRVLAETRETVIAVRPDVHVIDVRSTLVAGPVGVEIGPTRHAYFNARVADSIGLDATARPVDDRGREGGEAIGRTGAARVDFTGPIGHGKTAGITVLPDPQVTSDWFVADWGVMTVGPFHRTSLAIPAGEATRLACRFIAHDGPFQTAMLDGLPPLCELWEDAQE